MYPNVPIYIYMYNITYRYTFTYIYIYNYIHIKTPCLGWYPPTISNQNHWFSAAMRLADARKGTDQDDTGNLLKKQICSMGFRRGFNRDPNNVPIKQYCFILNNDDDWFVIDYLNYSNNDDHYYCCWCHDRHGLLQALTPCH